MTRRCDREVSAVTVNLKEQRLLDKTMHTLALERSYALKLLEVNHRLIKVNYRRLKHRVSKIKSYLKVDEIAELKQLEYEGKFKPEITSLNLSGAVQIAAASKRLNLGSGITQRPKTVPALVRPRQAEAKQDEKTDKATTARPNSVVGAFSDKPKGLLEKRRASTSLTPSIEESVRRLSQPKLAFTMSASNHKMGSSPSDKNRLVVGWNAEDKNRIRTAPPRVHKLYSSHLWSQINGRNSMTVPKNSDIRASGDSIDSNFGSRRMHNDKSELLENEFVNTAHIEDKRKDFLMKLESYIVENPLYLNDTTRSNKDGAAAELEANPSQLSQSKIPLHRLPSRLDINKHFSQEEYDRRMTDYWRDLNKCRYLRIPNEDIDYSGIETLVIAQNRKL